MGAKISKVVIEVGKHKFELSLNEAKELKQILGDLFQKDKEVVIERYRDYPWYPRWSTTCYWTSTMMQADDGSGDTLYLTAAGDSVKQAYTS